MTPNPIVLPASILRVFTGKSGFVALRPHIELGPEYSWLGLKSGVGLGSVLVVYNKTVSGQVA